MSKHLVTFRTNDFVANYCSLAATLRLIHKANILLLSDQERFCPDRDLREVITSPVIGVEASEFNNVANLDLSSDEGSAVDVLSFPRVSRMRPELSIVPTWTDCFDDASKRAPMTDNRNNS